MFPAPPGSWVSNERTCTSGFALSGLNGRSGRSGVAPPDSRTPGNRESGGATPDLPIFPLPDVQSRGMRWICAILAAAAFAMTGCSHKGYAADDGSRLHVGIVFDIGGKDDHSFNAAAWEGVRRA